VCNCVFRRNILIHLQSFTRTTGVCVTVYSGGISSFTSDLVLRVWRCSALSSVGETRWQFPTK